MVRGRKKKLEGRSREWAGWLVVPWKWETMEGNLYKTIWQAKAHHISWQSKQSGLGAKWCATLSKLRQMWVGCGCGPDLAGKAGGEATPFVR